MPKRTFPTSRKHRQRDLGPVNKKPVSFQVWLSVIYIELSVFLAWNHQPRSREDHSKLGFLCLRFRANRTPGGKTLPWIQFILLHGGVNIARNAGRLLHGGQNLPRDSGQTFARWGKCCQKCWQTFARGAKPSPRFRADFCTVGDGI